MKIQIEVDIFNDPKYCSGKTIQYCDFLNTFDHLGFCRLFTGECRHGVELKFDFSTFSWVKCDQCKSEYNKNKPKEVKQIRDREKRMHYSRDQESTVCGRKTFYINGRRNLSISKTWEYVTCENCLKLKD